MQNHGDKTNLWESFRLSISKENLGESNSLEVVSYKNDESNCLNIPLKQFSVIWNVQTTNDWLNQKIKRIVCRIAISNLQTILRLNIT